MCSYRLDAARPHRRAYGPRTFFTCFFLTGIVVPLKRIQVCITPCYHNCWKKIFSLCFYCGVEHTGTLELIFQYLFTDQLFSVIIILCSAGNLLIMTWLPYSLNLTIQRTSTTLRLLARSISQCGWANVVVQSSVSVSLAEGQLYVQKADLLGNAHESTGFYAPGPVLWLINRSHHPQ